MDMQQLKEIEMWVMGTMIVVMVVLWVFVKWAVSKSRQLEREEDANAKQFEEAQDLRAHPPRPKHR